MKKGIRKITALFLAAAIIASQSILAIAEDNSNMQYESNIISEEYVSPIYEGLVQESNLETKNNSNSISSYANEKIEYLTSKEECAAILREGMKQRQETIKVYYQADAYVNGLGTEIVKLACKHTGNPIEGDYLLASFKTVKAVSYTHLTLPTKF